MHENAVLPIMTEQLAPFNFTIHQYPNAIGLWPSEQASLLWLGLNSDPNFNWMEIGSFCGGSATILCLARQYLGGGPAVVSVDRNFDVVHDPLAHKMFFRNLGNFPELSRVIGTDSLDLAKHYDGSPLSFAFIDGWHSFKGCLSDFLIVEPWLVPGAMVAVHDVAQQPWTEQFIEEKYQNALANYDKWMAEVLPNPNAQQQDYNLDECVAYIIKTYGYTLVDIPTLDGTKNHLVALRKPGGV